eukprot:GILK01006413.1.p1 GENE.GILK01006413.1~~GILK01006413.1.p1  ORF type:complete len:234 (-),score=23.76 GILK01006413.1:238-900(-)
MAEADDVLAVRQQEILEKLKRIQDRMSKLPVTPFHAELFFHLRDRGLRSAIIKRVEDNYYSLSLRQRRNILGAPSIDHLCKTLVVENTACSHNDCSNPRNSRYYAVVIQYTTRLSSEKVLRFVRNMNINSTTEPQSKKFYNFQFCAEEVQEALTGYEKGSVTPFLMKSNIPVIVSAPIMDLQPPMLWLGGGELTLKLGMSLQDLSDALQPFVADVTQPEL